MVLLVADCFTLFWCNLMFVTLIACEGLDVLDLCFLLGLMLFECVFVLV